MKVELDDQFFLLEPLICPCFIKGADVISLSRFPITFFHRIQIVNEIYHLSVQHVARDAFSTCFVFVRFAQITDMLCVREIVEKLVTTSLKFISIYVTLFRMHVEIQQRLQ